VNFSGILRAPAGALLLLCAQAEAAVQLNSVPTNATRLDIPAPVLTLPSPALELTVPGGRQMRFATNVVNPRAGMFGVRGVSANGARLYLFIADGQVLSGDIYATGARYQIGAMASGLYWIDSAALGPQTDVPSLQADAQPVNRNQNNLDAAPQAAPGPDGNYIIDLLILQTPLYVQRMAGTNLAAEAERLVFLANGIFQTSAMPVRYRIAGIETYAHAPERDNYATNQSAMEADTGLRALRDRYGADLVVLLRTNDLVRGECGRSRLFNNGVNSDPPDSVDPERDAFVVVGAAPDETGFGCGQMEATFAHELGHAIGGGHEHTLPNIGTPYIVDANGGYWKPYAHAWTCGISGEVETTHVAATYYSIMFSNAGNSGNPWFSIHGWPRGDFFSDPSASRDGLPCGLPDGAPVGTDNRRSVIEAAPYVAAYRNSGSARNARAGGAAMPGSVLLLMLVASILSGGKRYLFSLSRKR